jgi:SOS-response transcriptional repressor LexA
MVTMLELRKRERTEQLYWMVVNSVAETGRSPSSSQVLDALGLQSRSAVWRMVDDLVRQGRLRRVFPHGDRRIRSRQLRPTYRCFVFDPIAKELQLYQPAQPPLVFLNNESPKRGMAAGARPAISEETGGPRMMD